VHFGYWKQRQRCQLDVENSVDGALCGSGLDSASTVPCQVGKGQRQRCILAYHFGIVTTSTVHILWGNIDNGACFMYYRYRATFGVWFTLTFGSGKHRDTIKSYLPFSRDFPILMINSSIFRFHIVWLATHQIAQTLIMDSQLLPNFSRITYALMITTKAILLLQIFKEVLHLNESSFLWYIVKMSIHLKDILITYLQNSYDQKTKQKIEEKRTS